MISQRFNPNGSDCNSQRGKTRKLQLFIIFSKILAKILIQILLIVSYFEGEARVIAFPIKNGMNMRKIASHGKLNLPKVDLIEWHTAW